MFEYSRIYAHIISRHPHSSLLAARLAFQNDQDRSKSIWWITDAFCIFSSLEQRKHLFGAHFTHTADTLTIDLCHFYTGICVCLHLFHLSH